MNETINGQSTARTLMDIIQGRYSCRNYKAEQISKDSLDYILEAGRLAPTAKNLQEQHIYVLQSPQSIEHIDVVTHSRYGAPTCLVITWDKENTYTYPGGKYDSGAEDATIVATHIMLAAQAIGLGTCWVNAFDPDRLHQLLNLPANEQILMILSVGIPSPDAKPSPRHDDRKPTEETVTYM